MAKPDLINNGILGQAWTSSGIKTSDASAQVIKAAAGILHGILVETDGTNAVSITAYDNASEASGEQLTPSVVVVGANYLGGVLGLNVGFDHGCTILLSGTNGKAVVYYE